MPPTRTIMASSGIHFTEETPPGIGWTNVDGIVCVPERVILLSEARAYFETELEGVLQLGHKVLETAAEARVARGGISASVITAERALMAEQIVRDLPIFPKLFRYVGPQLAIKARSIGANDDRSCQVSRRSAHELGFTNEGNQSIIEVGWSQFHEN